MLTNQRHFAFLTIWLILSLHTFVKASYRPSYPDHGRATQRAADRIKKYKIKENDTTSYVLNLAFDEAGHPAYFFRNIFTPVCYTNECKPVYINFYWDLLGNYMRYDMPKGKVLTKVDHDEFKPDEYEKLADILAKPNSIFAGLKMEDLISKGTENLADSVDAKAGATLKTIKNEVIDGAVYTCFTLWHIAYGHTSEEIKSIIENYVDDRLLHEFLATSNHHYQYYAMGKVMDQHGNIQPAFTEDIKHIIKGKNVFVARQALQKTSPPFFKSTEMQTWLWESYRTAGYTLQISILKKLQDIPLCGELTLAIANDIAATNEEQSDLMTKLLIAQPSLTNATLEKLSTQLTKGENYSSKIYSILDHFQPNIPTIKSEMERYIHSKK